MIKKAPKSDGRMYKMLLTLDVSKYTCTQVEEYCHAHEDSLWLKTLYVRMFKKWLREFHGASSWELGFASYVHQVVHGRFLDLDRLGRELKVRELRGDFIEWYKKQLEERNGTEYQG